VVALGVEAGRAVAAVLLRPVQRGVGGLHQVGGAGAAVAALHDPDARGDDDPVGTEHDRAPDRLQSALCQALQLLACSRACGQVLRDHDELVAAHPGDEVAAVAQLGREPVGHGLQQLVADVVAEGVVDGLEAVEVEVADADVRGGGQRRVELLEEQRAVGQPGERVVLRLVAQ
jgi:hypothetical protein